MFEMFRKLKLFIYTISTGGSYGKASQKLSGKKHEQAVLKRHRKWFFFATSLYSHEFIFTQIINYVSPTDHHTSFSWKQK